MAASLLVTSVPKAGVPVRNFVRSVIRFEFFLRHRFRALCAAWLGVKISLGYHAKENVVHYYTILQARCDEPRLPSGSCPHPLPLAQAAHHTRPAFWWYNARGKPYHERMNRKKYESAYESAACRIGS